MWWRYAEPAAGITWSSHMCSARPGPRRDPAAPGRRATARARPVNSGERPDRSATENRQGAGADRVAGPTDRTGGPGRRQVPPADRPARRGLPLRLRPGRSRSARRWPTAVIRSSPRTGFTSRPASTGSRPHWTERPLRNSHRAGPAGPPDARRGRRRAPAASSTGTGSGVRTGHRGSRRARGVLLLPSSPSRWPTSSSTCRNPATSGPTRCRRSSPATALPSWRKSFRPKAIASTSTSTRCRCMCATP